MHTRRTWSTFAVALLATLFVLVTVSREARAVPSFARKYQTSCQTCHTVYPMLNPFGEAFRRDGYRFPSQNGSVDSDAVKANTIALGQEEYVKTFPDTVWPDKIADAIPLSVMFNGQVPVNLPDSDAKAAAGNTFTWGGIEAELHLFGAGAFNDTLTYMTQLTFADSGSFDIETAYLLWNDIVGPRHAFNLWVGRLFAPQITSFALHSDYLSDALLPGVSVAGLYNGAGANAGSTFTLGQGHTDGAELNGIVGHRFGYSLGWVASATGPGLSQVPNAEDAYAHIGIKSGGVALDGEGKYGPNVPDPRKPWAEKAITLDLFGYHGMSRLDNGTGVVNAIGTAAPVLQDDRFNALGGSIHAQWDSLLAQVTLDVEKHERPYAATSPGTGALLGVPNYTGGQAVVGSAEIDYVVWPWFVPGVRAQYTSVDVAGASSQATLLRLIPGVAMAVRPNVRVLVTGDIEQGHGLPPAGWGAAGAAVVPGGPDQTKFQAEQLFATVNVAY
jgi:hypothetical protein